MSSPDEPQVSWMVIEAGAPIISSDGEKAATVSRVVGDTEADVFTGLAVKVGGLSGERFIPSESVQGIWPDRIEVALNHADLEGLPAYRDAPVVRIEPEEPGFFDRLFRRRR